MPPMEFDMSVLGIKILSINEAVEEVILVGWLIIGYSKCDKLVSMKSFVGG